jgi:hypothetical protein
LVPVDGRPLVYGLFDRFPEASFVVVVDHLAEVFERYLACFPPSVPVVALRARGKGTLGGLAEAIRLMPDDDTPFLLVWGDLRIGALPDEEVGEVIRIGLTSAFTCRWSWSSERGLTERASNDAGVMGLFAVPGRRVLPEVPVSGEFVRWLASSRITVDPVRVKDAAEFGTIPALDAHRRSTPSTRPFNTVEIEGNTVRKKARDPRYRYLIDGEIAWYREAARLGFQHVPSLLSEAPMTLARVRGRHPFDLAHDPDGQRSVLRSIVGALEQLHACGEKVGSRSDTWDVYHRKTLDRLAIVRRLSPDLTERATLQVDGVTCRNILHPEHAEWFRACIDALGVRAFTPIHGDPTFSNILVDDDGRPWFIDPRGHFGEHISIFGDPRYDWAKLYYSVAGSYDNFNGKRFQLKLTPGNVDLRIDDCHWEHLGPELEALFGDEAQCIQVIHALIWLSLSGFVHDDHDAILGAYARGLYLLQEATL